MSESAAEIILGRVEGIDTAEELLQTLQDALRQNGNLRIDGSAVISLDSTTLQMLAVLIQDCTNTGKSVVWSGVSGKLRKSADLLGLTDFLQLPEKL